MTESSAAFLSPPQTWHRDRYRLALVGAEAAKHRDLVSRAGYVVVVALDGHEASTIFHGTEPFDVVVLDFALKGRPPEAVLLFSRRTSPGAPCIALVASDDAEQFRRAFLGGARDVLPVPARGEDLLSSIDTVLEPRALGELVEGLKHEMARGPVRPPGAAPDAGVRVIVDDRAREEAGALRQQAMDAFAERDRAVQARASGQKKVTSLRRQIKERDQRLALMERACEELTGKLKALRDERRTFEARALEAERRIALLETALAQPGSVLLESASTNPGLSRFVPAGMPKTSPGPMPSDPDAEARLFETDDHHHPRIAPPMQPARGFRRGHEQGDEDTISVRLKAGGQPGRGLGSAAGDELEHVFHSYVESERRIAELRDELEHGSRAESDIDFVDAGDVLSARHEDERRLEELESKLERRAVLEKRVKELEEELVQADELKLRVAELEAALAARERGTVSKTDLTRTPDHAAALRRIGELEALLTERDGKLSAIESARTLEKQDHRRQNEAAQSALIAERESHAEARGILDAIRMERDALRRRVIELEREAAEALTRVEELTPLLTDLERMRAELRAEKSQHVVTRRALTEAAGRGPVADVTGTDVRR